MLVLLDEAGCPIARTARPWDRIAVRLHAFSLDRDLAAGASPDASVALALRAHSSSTRGTGVAWLAARAGC